MMRDEACTNVRDCTATDFEGVRRLLSQLWPDVDVSTPEMRHCFHRGLLSPSQRYFCTVVDDVVAGFCSLSVKDNLWQQGLIGHVDELVVDQRHRDIGIGSALLQRAEEIAVAMGCKRLELDSAHHRVKAHGFYESLGFQNRALLYSKAIATKEM